MSHEEPRAVSNPAEQHKAPLEVSFDHEPTFAELWEMCVYNLLYNEKAYCDEIEKLFAKYGVTKESRILDVSAGSGFPALELTRRGYKVDCADGFADEVDLFNQRAKEENLEASCQEIMWSDLPGQFEAGSYDFLFCRGNSFIYATGGWNQEVIIDPNSAMNDYKNTAKIFYELLKPGGHMYIDKFRDDETSHKATVALIDVEGKKEDLIFWTERFSDQKLRRASMLRRGEDGKEPGVPNISYDLTIPEMTESLTAAGYTNIEEYLLTEEKEFTVLIAAKPE